MKISIVFVCFLWIASCLPSHAQLKPNGGEVLVKLTFLLPDGKPLKNEDILIIRLGARNTEYPFKTNEKGYAEILLPKGIHYKVDFKGRAKPRMISTPYEPNKEIILK